MALTLTTLRIPALVLALVFLVFSQTAWAGRLSPDLEEQLATLPPGGKLRVIVEMVTQADPAAAADTAPRRQRLARKRAVRDILQMVADTDQAAVRALLGREQSLGNVERLRTFWVFNGLSMTATEAVIRGLAARSDVYEVRSDRTIRRPPPIRLAAVPGPSASVSEWNIDQIRAPEVWALDPSYTGVGSVVGSFDSGVDWSHPDLQSRYRGDHSISWFDPYGEHASPFDVIGHGTHTTGTAVGGDAAGTNIGVAPGAQWIAAKAWNDQGTALASAFHQIFEWFLAPGGDPANAPDVINSSWAFALGGCITEFEADILALRAAGIFPAFAAGNDGPGDGSVRSPGAEGEAFAVGATDFFDEIAPFSGRGPSPCGGIVKPDLSAPGVSILSAVPGGEYVPADGTSMATPHVTGAVAVLRSIDPTLTVDELEAVLTQGAVDLGPAGPDDTFGAGRLDLFLSAQLVLGGLDQPIVRIAAEPAFANELGPTTATVTVSRTGGSTDEPLTVHLAISGTATAGSDYVSLAGSVTIPAGSTTTAMTVTPIDDPTPEREETVIVTLSPDPAYIVGPPGHATVRIVSDETLPDLVIPTLAVPPSVGILSAFTVTETTSNQGGTAAGISTTRYYLSRDAAFDASDVALGSRSIPALAVGAASSGSTTLTLPTGTAPGPYYFLARADADGAIEENEEGNNTNAVAIQVRVEIIVLPNTIDITAPPNSFNITGGGFADGIGLPVVNFVRAGTLLAQARATQMTGSTELIVPFPTAATALTPDLPGLSAGTVQVQVWLQTASDFYVQLASTTLTVTDPRPAPGVGGMTPATVDLASPPNSFTITGGGFEDLGFGLPVVNFMRGTTLLAQARATQLMETTTLTVPFPTAATSLTPNVPGLSAGPVQVQVWLQTGAGAYKLLGSTTLTVTDSRGVSGITPATFDLAMAPERFSITGGGFADLGFGLPIVNFMRGTTLLAQARAILPTSALELTVPFPTAATSLTPNVPGLSAGSVRVEVHLQTGAAAYKLLGSTTLTVTDSRPAPGVSGITPNAIDLADAPGHFTITGNGFADLGHGRPVVNFTRGSTLLAQARADALTSTIELSVPFPTAATSLTPNVPGLSAGPVQVQVWLQTTATTFTLLGSTALSVTDTRPGPGVSTISPSTIALVAPPEFFTITGGGFEDRSFGLPVVNFVRSGTLLAQARATGLTDTTTLTVPYPTAQTSLTPNVPGLSPGPVQVQVWLQTGAGSYQLLGSVGLTVQ